MTALSYLINLLNHMYIGFIRKKIFKELIILGVDIIL